MERKVPTTAIRRRIEYEDDIVVVYDENDKVIYKGLEDYEPMKDENWVWNSSMQAYILDSYIKICLDV